MTSVCIGLGYYYFQESALSYGVLFGLGLIGAFQILVGLVRFLRTFKEFNRAAKANDNNSTFLIETEFPRIQNLIKKFRNMRNIESIIFIIAILIFAIGWALKADKFLLGTAAGLCFHAAVMLVFDLFSESRSQEYLHQLGKLIDGYKSDLL